MSYDTFAGWEISNDWAGHAAYSLGGDDYPLPYGTIFGAPASGTWRTSGGEGERKAGWVGSAGRRGILELDTPIGDMVAIVFQHLSDFNSPGWRPEGSALAASGASANGRDWGGDVHMHVHGLDKNGNRVSYPDNIGDDMALDEKQLAAIAHAVWSQPLTTTGDKKVTGRATDWLLNMSDMIGDILRKPSTIIDPSKLAQAFASAGIKLDADTAAIVKALDASLRDDFAAIPGAVRDAIIK